MGERSMKTYPCITCQAPVYLALSDPDNPQEVLQVEVEESADGDIALAQRYVGPGNGTMLEDDHVVIWRRIHESEIYQGVRRRVHRCPMRDNYDWGKNPPIQTCRSCKAKIIWTVTENGKRMPVDPMPCPDGNLALVMLSGGVLESRVVKGDDRQDLYLSHFTTCPNANRHRRRR